MSRNAHPAGPRHGDVLPESQLATPPGDLNRLDPAIWPASARRVDGVLELGGVPVTTLVTEYGTPALFLDEDDLRARARAYAGSGVGAYYAGKAFLCTTLARWVAQEGLGLDVCTGGELAVALAAQFPPERIGLHGNNKSGAELRRAVEAGVGHVGVDSFDEIARLT
ncbi:MAG: diaminopimelate decarboxylase, partial [Actinobacteria bacterium]|nr:diaminopimelate decarboxylase [Actinomycetota bacterium]